MGLLDNWAESFRSVLSGPTEHFRTETRMDGFSYPLKFAVISLVIAGFFNAVKTGFIGSTLYRNLLPLGSSVALAGAALVISPIVGLAGLLVWSGVVHLFSSAFGGSGSYSDTLAVFEYASAINPISALVTVVPMVGGIAGLLLSIYAVYIQIVGIMEAHDLDSWRAGASVVLPGLIVIGVALALMIAFFSALSGMMQTTPPMPY